MVDETPFAELRVPTPGSAIASTLGYSLGLVLMLVAAGNLVYVHRIPTSASIASVLWLVIVSWIVISNLRDEGGIRQYVVNRLGAYSQHHFIRATPHDAANTISIGYVLFHRPLNFLTIGTTAISSISWDSGQATAMSGRDMNDWHVALWYRHIEGPQRRPFPGLRDEEIFIIGRSGARSTKEIVGKQLVEFLLSVGLELMPGRSEREFDTPSRRKATKHMKD